ncbi:hypothetical protein HU675_0037280 [Bradyrhizobium septentrionale]|uniref:hypothetical protein n=1 Tax=Bradyrhizobium septentrionale TaxID=1404411 RepID=UPI001F2A687D|nr:hypothetical protein [Bradyrhizobium septentrionale]UGY23551.1 hypothetical protein HU675_0037280 [Bradyrhizobium septentrionale]
MDERGAALTLEYFHRRVHGPAFKDEDEDTAAYYQGPLEFFRSHGQSLDWVHQGNPGGLICGLAKHSSRAREVADAAKRDPIFDLIEQHKQAVRELDGLCPEQAVLEKEIPHQHRKSDLWCGELTIDPSDDPRWIDLFTKYRDLGDKEGAAAIELVLVEPTTLSGVLALLTYASEHTQAGYVWPDNFVVDDRIRDWDYLMRRSVVASLQRLEA